MARFVTRSLLPPAAPPASKEPRSSPPGAGAGAGAGAASPGRLPRLERRPPPIFPPNSCLLTTVGTADLTAVMKFPWLSGDILHVQSWVMSAAGAGADVVVGAT